MKKVYESPVFMAEEYSFSESIAKCAHQVDPNKPLTINPGDNVCGNGLDGHVFGGQNQKKGTIFESGVTTTVTLFNDLATPDEKNDCEYDWDYSQNIVYSPSGDDMGSFAVAFYGNDASEGNHAPGYMGVAFFS